MNLLETLKVSIEGIWLNKVRSILTVLGIIIGTATVILVVAVGQGSQQAVNDQFSKLSVSTLYIMANMPGQSGSENNSKLSVKDIKVLEEKAPSIVMMSPQLSGRVDASFGTVKQQTTVLGVSETYTSLTNLKFTQGTFFTEQSEVGKEKIAVIGADVAETLFADPDSEHVGKYIKINNQRYLVAGIIARIGDSTGGSNIDESILIPYTTAERYILGNSVKPRIVAQAKDLDSVNIAIDEITVALREAHRLKPGDINDFGVRDAGSRLASAQQTAKTMSVLLISIATIVLIVGGIGIMNVMLVSVRERIKEIGVRMAIGARKKDILRQFLFEAIGLSLLGGVIGTIIGQIAIPIVEHFDVEIVRSVWGVVIAMGFSGIVGIFFGFYPAYKAANLNPIEALRYE